MRKRNVRQTVDFVAICLRASFYKLILIARFDLPYFHAYIIISDMISLFKQLALRWLYIYILIFYGCFGFFPTTKWFDVVVVGIIAYSASPNCFLFLEFTVCVIWLRNFWKLLIVSHVDYHQLIVSNRKKLLNLLHDPSSFNCSSRNVCRRFIQHTLFLSLSLS